MTPAAATNTTAGVWSPGKRRQHVALAEIVRSVIAEESRTHPQAEILFNVWDEAFGAWDAQRLTQLVRDLLASSFAHGGPGLPFLVSVSECGGTARLCVVSSSRRADCRREVWALRRVRRIVRAHGGRSLFIRRKNDRVFHVSLPKYVS